MSTATDNRCTPWCEGLSLADAVAALDAAWAAYKDGTEGYAGSLPDGGALWETAIGIDVVVGHLKHLAGGAERTDA